MVTSSLPSGKLVGRLVVGVVGRRFLRWGSTVQCNSDVVLMDGLALTRQFHELQIMYRLLNSEQKGPKTRHWVLLVDVSRT
jgi:hypothetical protein